MAGNTSRARFRVDADGSLRFDNASFRCAIGKGGMIEAARKQEGDGASPVGSWPLRRVFWRPDRVSEPETVLPKRTISQFDGWCDATDHPAYNQLVTLPMSASHERLWRDDHVYDVVVELGYNDDPVVAGKGSAIFLHIARPDYKPTQGCAALALEDLLAVLRVAKPGDALAFISNPAGGEHHSVR